MTERPPGDPPGDRLEHLVAPALRVLHRPPSGGLGREESRFRPELVERVRDLPRPLYTAAVDDQRRNGDAGKSQRPQQWAVHGRHEIHAPVLDALVLKHELRGLRRVRCGESVEARRHAARILRPARRGGRPGAGTPGGRVPGRPDLCDAEATYRGRSFGQIA